MSSSGTMEQSGGSCLSEAAGNTGGGGWETGDNGHSPKEARLSWGRGKAGAERKSWVPRLQCSWGPGPGPEP